MASGGTKPKEADCRRVDMVEESAVMHLKDSLYGGRQVSRRVANALCFGPCLSVALYSQSVW